MNKMILTIKKDCRIQNPDNPRAGWSETEHAPARWGGGAERGGAERGHGGAVRPGSDVRFRPPDEPRQPSWRFLRSTNQRNPA